MNPLLFCAIALVRGWTRLYTWRMDPASRDRPPRGNRIGPLGVSRGRAASRLPRLPPLASRMMARLAGGMPHDLLWRFESVDERGTRTSPTTAWLTAAADRRLGLVRRDLDRFSRWRHFVVADAAARFDPRRAHVHARAAARLRRHHRRVALTAVLRSGELRCLPCCSRWSPSMAMLEPAHPGSTAAGCTADGAGHGDHPRPRLRRRQREAAAPRAHHGIVGPELGRDGRTTSTSVDGRYEIGDLPAGRYTIRVTRAAATWRSSTASGVRSNRASRCSSPTSRRSTASTSRCRAPSVISGQIIDELGEPVADVQVFAMRSAYYQGRRRMVPAGPPARTDDAGEYRLTGLSPGSYYVMATLRETWTVTENGVERTMGYAPTYAPGTPSLTDARRVNVAIGQSAGNNNFALMPGSAASVSGTATDSLGRPIVGRNIMLMQEFRRARRRRR